ncbi:MAG: beta-galactosidase, partial [Anaerolinea sp.]|nr:beta-galactosidase [Anaerolinea sp.]
MGISVGQHGLTVDGETIPIYAGTIHYWRHPPVMWEPLLRSIEALGFHMIETYIPWGVHETAPRRFDFGQENPANDLDRFLCLCEQLNLWVCVRPAPVSNAELTFWGCPEHVLSDPAVQARTSQDTPAIVDYPPQPFAVPSYASERFYAYIAGWFDDLCPRLIPHLYPSGRIIACQVDNELTYFFRTDAYYLDYHPDAVQQYREMLRRDYRTIDALNYAYHSAYADFDQIPPPRGCAAQTASDLPYYLDWVRYKEQQLTAALVRLA